MEKAKQNVKNVGKLIFVLIIAMMFFGCFLFETFETFENPFELGRFEDQGLDEKTENQILSDCVKYLNKINNTKDFTLNHIAILEYYGIYQESIVVNLIILGFLLPPISERYCVSGILFHDSMTRPDLVWNAGSVYTLTEARKSGLLTQDDIQYIAEKMYIDISIPLCPGCLNCIDD